MRPTKLTNRLFYKKYPFRIRFMVPRVYRYLRLAKIVNPEPEESTKLFMEKFNELDKTSIRCRTEANIISIFCLDNDTKNEVVVKLNKWLFDICEPANETELDIIKDNYKKILCNRLPYFKYRYRIHVNLSLPMSVRESVLKWTKSVGNRVKLTPSSELWLAGEMKWYCGPLTIYVEDNSLVTMAVLLFGSSVRSIDEFISRSSINTLLDQDTVCQHSALD